MKKLKVFNFITLDGYFAGAEKDIRSWLIPLFWVEAHQYAKVSITF